MVRTRVVIGASLAIFAFGFPGPIRGAEPSLPSAPLPFVGEHTDWHGFQRYDFVMDEATLAITALKAPEGEGNTVGAPPKGQRKELGGKITVILKEGEGHYPLAPKDSKPVVDFIVGSVN
jgi:hypothetical protein